MLLYDFEKIINATDGNVNDCFAVLDMLTHQKIPSNRFDKYYKYSNINFSGGSFMLHPEVAFYNSYKYTKREMVQYFGLGAFRLTSRYIANQTVTMSVHQVPLDRNLYIENRLLRIDDDDIIHWRYEEVTTKEIH